MLFTDSDTITQPSPDSHICIVGDTHPQYHPEGPEGDVATALHIEVGINCGRISYRCEAPFGPITAMTTNIYARAFHESHRWNNSATHADASTRTTCGGRTGSTTCGGLPGYMLALVDTNATEDGDIPDTSDLARIGRQPAIDLLCE